MQNLNFLMEHGSKNLVKEKQLLKEIKASQKREDSFASFWNQWEEDLANVSENVRLNKKTN